MAANGNKNMPQSIINPAGGGSAGERDECMKDVFQAIPVKFCKAANIKPIIITE